MADPLPLLEPGKQLPAALQQRGLSFRAQDRVPQSVAEWAPIKADLRKNLLQSWGGFPAEPCDLSPQKVGEIDQGDYRIEKLLLQTMPGVWASANAYVPKSEGKHAAVLCVHGHWKGAKQDPVVQSRCIGLAKLGFFVLAVDAMGAGERGVGKALGEYHGEMVGATLWPVGRPLSGVQVYENMRVADYLQSRPEVDPNKLGITGASGGGNQTMYAGAYDERFQCVVPVCSVGTYQAYLQSACCLCEVVPNAISYTEEWALLGLVAPRALMVINATRDSFNFSIGEAQKTIAGAQHVFRLYGAAGKISHDLFESGHDYGKEMRESMYGWMTLHLKGEGKGNPIPEPQFEPLDPQALRCFPEDSRPDDYLTLPRLAAREGQQMLARFSTEKLAHREHWEANVMRMQHTLRSKILGNSAKFEAIVGPAHSNEAGVEGRRIQTEAGIEITLTRYAGSKPEARTAIILDLAGTAHATNQPLVKELAAAGWHRIHLELRGTGEFAVAGDKIGRAPDHNTGEWSAWTARPLLGQWIYDVQQALGAIRNLWPTAAANGVLIGFNSAALVAWGATVDQRWKGPVVMVDPLASYLSDTPYEGQWLGIMAPGIVRDVGDIPQLVALAAPQPVVIAGSVRGNGTALTAEELAGAWSYSQKVYELMGGNDKLQVLPQADPAAILKRV